MGESDNYWDIGKSSLQILETHSLWVRRLRGDDRGGAAVIRHVGIDMRMFIVKIQHRLIREYLGGPQFEELLWIFWGRVHEVWHRVLPWKKSEMKMRWLFCWWRFGFGGF